MRYYVNGKRTTKESYKAQDKKNKDVLDMPLNTKEEREAFLKEMQNVGFLTAL